MYAMTLFKILILMHNALVKHLVRK